METLNSIIKMNKMLKFNTVTYLQKSNEYGYVKDGTVYLNTYFEDLLTNNVKLIIKNKSAINEKILHLKRKAFDAFSGEELFETEEKYIKNDGVFNYQSILNGLYINEILLDAILEKNNFSSHIKQACKGFRSIVFKKIKEYAKSIKNESLNLPFSN